MRFRRWFPATWALVLVLSSIATREAGAAWPRYPHVNLPLAPPAGTQAGPTITSDGAGGTIVVWEDGRAGALNSDIYVQHILPTGVVDPAWPAGGRALCTAAGHQISAQIVADGSGGAIIAWQDLRGVDRDLYAQHVLASGAVDPAWPANGRALCTAVGDQLEHNIESDGTGGAIVTWQDLRGASFDIYAQRVLASGMVDPAWPVDGRALCTAALDQAAPELVADGAGGAIVAWEDSRGATTDIYAQRVLASGAVDPIWPADGQALCTALGGQTVAVVAPDGAGGAIVAWQDTRSGTSDIYAQRVLGSGQLDPAWPVDGRGMCLAADNQTEPVVVADGAGGAIVAWHDFRTLASFDIYAQRVLNSGQVDPLWPVNGRALSTAVLDQLNPDIVTDGAGGAIVAWEDQRSGAGDVYAQHVLATGAVDSNWPGNGLNLCTAPLTQVDPVAVSDGAGGVIAAWQDDRGGAGGVQVFAQRAARFGYLGSPEPEIASVLDVANDQGGSVKLSWAASYADTDPSPVVTEYWILRSVPTSLARAAARDARIVRLGESEAAPEPGSLVATESAAGADYWEFLTSVPALHIVSGYSYVAPTTGDSTGASNPLTRFMVVATCLPGPQYWASVPMGGYSVDNLPPASPSPFTATLVGSAIHLRWEPNPEADVAGYRLHRGATPGFVPSPGNLLSAQADTGFVDTAAPEYFYKLSAIDAHGNQGPFALAFPAGTVDVGPVPRAGEVSLARPIPNPAAREAVFRFTLPRAGVVRLGVFDPLGRRVRSLRDGAADAGGNSVRFDLADEAGRALPSGLYYVQLAAEGRLRVRPFVVMR